MDEDDEPITIDHLVDIKCVLNDGMYVWLRKNRSKNNRIELFSDDETYYLVVSKVIDFTADGGYIIKLSRPGGRLLTNDAVLIAESLFLKKKRKGATI